MLLAVLGSIVWVARFGDVTGGAGGSFGPAARIMLVVVGIGATVLWPMVRMSQASPAGSVISHVCADLLVVLGPIQLVVWPLVVLAGWPVGIVAAVDAVLAAWAALCGGLLAIAMVGSRATRPGEAALLARSVWMMVITLVVLMVPVAVLLRRGGAGGTPEWLAMLSPVTAIPRIAGSGTAGPQDPVTGLEIRMICATAGVAAGVWVVAWVREMLGKRAGRG